MGSVAKITKVLSKNDAGEGTKRGHGVLIPKDPVFQSFFPALDASQENPSSPLECTDARSGQRVDLVYRYYNKTKNEFRVTGITKYLHDNGAVTGSRLSFSKNANGDYVIDLESPGGNGGSGAIAVSGLQEDEPASLPKPGLPLVDSVATPKRRLRIGMDLALSIVKGWEVSESI